MPLTARRAIIDWLNERQIRPDMILIGEPTSVDRLGDTVKIGRRGSVNMWIEVPGVQGHVAYPHRATNPVPPLARVIAALDAVHLDDGTEQFPPSNLEFTAISTPTNASNVIPGSATAQLNIRFNNLQRGEDLVRMVEEIAEREAPGSSVARAHFRRSVPDPTRSALRRGRRSDPRGDRHRRPSYRPAAERRTAASSSSFARWSTSASPMRPCTRSAKARRSRTSTRCRGSTSGWCGRCSARLPTSRRGDRRCRSSRGTRSRTSAGRRRSPGRCRSPWREGCRPGPRSRPLRRRSRTRPP